jgi:hypothetical protein
MSDDKDSASLLQLLNSFSRHPLVIPIVIILVLGMTVRRTVKQVSPFHVCVQAKVEELRTECFRDPHREFCPETYGDQTRQSRLTALADRERKAIEYCFDLMKPELEVSVRNRGY